MLKLGQQISRCFLQLDVFVFWGVHDGDGIPREHVPVILARVVSSVLLRTVITHVRTSVQGPSACSLEWRAAPLIWSTSTPYGVVRLLFQQLRFLSTTPFLLQIVSKALLDRTIMRTRSNLQGSQTRRNVPASRKDARFPQA